MRQSIHKSKLGFTLVELLVVIAIMSTLAAIIFPKIGNYSSGLILNQSALGFIGIIRAAQANAISGTLCGDSYSPSNKAKYWGFYADPKLGNKYYYRAYCVDSNGNFLNSIPEIDLNYPSGVSLTDVSILDSTGTSCPLTNGDLAIAAFSNITGAVVFKNGTNAPVTMNPEDSTGTCQDSTKPNLQTIRYTLSSAQYKASIYVFIDKSGSVYSQFP